jgi:hypothetical protein
MRSLSRFGVQNLNQSLKRFGRNCVMVAALGVLSAATQAQVFYYNVSLDTSALVSNPGQGPYKLDFQFTDGSGTNDGNNTVSLFDFHLGGGTVVNLPTTLTGGASGTVGSFAQLTDSAFLNEATQEFMPGGTLSFIVAFSNNPDAGITPDEFSFAILDGLDNELQTLGPTGGFLVIDQDAGGPIVNSYASDPGATVVLGSAPSITFLGSVPPGGPGGPGGGGGGASVPEPGTYAMGAGMAISALLTLRKRRSR